MFVSSIVESAEEVNLSGKSLRKLTKASCEASKTTKSLILDCNDLQKLDNIDSYIRIEKLSVSHNQLLRMYGVCRLNNLRVLDLSHNGILTIEGLRDLVHLTHLNLSNNSIKTIEHLQSNVNLECLDLSHNTILSLVDISHMKKLKQLHLHSNRIVHLRQCDKFLPVSISTLTLAQNSLGDLNDVSHLVSLDNLIEFSIEGNPCVSMTGGSIGFDYRPFIINWIMNLKVLDSYVITPIESLKAEWLYSQGRGRQFAIGEHQSLCRYLATTCPLSEKALETEDNRKLRLILSKAQQHQQQLREQMSSSTGCISNTSSPSSSRRTNRIDSPKITNSRLSSHLHSPSHMTNSYHGSNSSITNDDNKILENIINDSSAIMTQSLDSALNLTNANVTAPVKEKKDKPLVSNNQNSYDINDFSSPLRAAKKLVPVPESLMSPDVQPGPIRNTTVQPINQPQNIVATTQIAKSSIPRTSSPKGSPRASRSPKFQHTNKSSVVSSLRSSPSPNRQRKHPTQHVTDSAEPTPPDIVPSNTEENNTLDADKLQAIRKRARIIQQERNSNMINQVNGNTENNLDKYKDAEKHIVAIQKVWRGFYTRKKCKPNVAKKINDSRMRDYIEQLTSDMAATKTALESERKIQQLQMQAISALWKKVSHIPSCSGDGQGVGAHTESHPKPPDQCGDQEAESSNRPIRDLENTCSHLQQQVRELQTSMNEVMQHMGKLCQTVPGFMNKNKEDCSTQTDVVAVHTPQDEHKFPFANKASRPSTLPLPVSQQTQTNDCDNKHIHTQTQVDSEKTSEESANGNENTSVQENETTQELVQENSE